MATEAITPLDLYRADFGLVPRMLSFGHEADSVLPPSSARTCSVQGEQHVG